ncbi:MAG: DUF1501 domain-containing protein [Planctomycetota bacterium]
MSNSKFFKDPFNRRSFVTGAAKTFLGIGSMPLLANLASAANVTGPGINPKAKAKSVIYLYMSGGMSHLDTFDTKPGAETQGPVDSIKTSADGVQISQFFPNVAKQMHNVAVVNSMNSTQGAHAQGRYFMHTSYFLRGTVRHPDMGAWASRFLGKINKGLPANVKIGGNSSGLGAGFLESQYAALPIGDPESGLQYSKMIAGMTNQRFGSRLRKLRDMNAGFASKYDTKEARAYASMYDEAVTLMKSKDLAAFDLTQEAEEMRDRYGRNRFGQACLLARRLVENGVRFIEVDDGGWDTHGNNFERVGEKGAVLDQALGALLADLESSGLLDSTMVVLATEFGRTPKIHPERDNGRNHYPQAFSCLLAGAGIKGGLKYGSTDDEGREVTDNMVVVPDFNATIATALGIPINEEVISPDKRPFTVADKGTPVKGLLS